MAPYYWRMAAVSTGRKHILSMVQLIPSVQNHLRERLHNRKITMTVRVSAPTENIRAYSHVERFQMMSKKNPNLLKLKEALGLELS